jgi:hypothetical protein
MEFVPCARSCRCRKAVLLLTLRQKKAKDGAPSGWGEPTEWAIRPVPSCGPLLGALEQVVAKWIAAGGGLPWEHGLRARKTAWPVFVSNARPVVAPSGLPANGTNRWYGRSHPTASTSKVGAKSFTANRILTPISNGHIRPECRTRSYSEFRTPAKVGPKALKRFASSHLLHDRGQSSEAPPRIVVLEGQTNLDSPPRPHLDLLYGSHLPHYAQTRGNLETEI